MRYSIDSLGRPVREPLGGLGQCPALDDPARGLGQIVVRGGGGRFVGSRSFVFRPFPQPYYYNYPYYWWQPAYQYGSSCPVAIALTAAQSAMVAAGQAVSVYAQNQCGATVQVTVQGAAVPPPAGRAANAPASTVY